MATRSFYTNKLELYTCTYIQIILYQISVAHLESPVSTCMILRLSGQQHTFVLEYTPSLNRVCHMKGSKGVALAVDSHKPTDNNIPCLGLICQMIPGCRAWP